MTATASPGAGRPASASSDGWPARAGATLRAARQTRAWRWGRWPLAALAALLLMGFIAFTYLYATVSLPDEPPQIQSSIVLDAKGRELAVLQKDELRVEVGLDEVAPVVVQALIAAEDRNFRDHDGIDPRGLARAVLNNAGGGDTQGGSTITQQLVKNTYLSSEQTYSRKVKEAVLAIKLDRGTDKDEILERYLNVVYFGRGTYGIEAAAKVYFDTTAAELTPPQAALLIGLLRAPERADPTDDPETATARRNAVLDDLAEVGDLTAAEAEEHKAAELGTVPEQPSVTLRAGVGAHVVEWIRQQAIEQFGEEAVYGGGLVIETSIDIDQQRVAELAVTTVLDQPDDPQAAMVVVDVLGGVKAHVGGRDFRELEVDLARGAEGGGSGRQPGSAFKPLVLAAAIEDEIATLGSTYPAPSEITLETEAGPWTVGNYGGSGFGVTDLTGATANSINTTYAQLMLDVGPQRAVDLAGQVGVGSTLRPDPSLVLGTGEVSVLEMASAYSTFGRDGVRIDPYVITRVSGPDERVLFEVEPQTQQVLQEGTARAVNHALQAVIAEGTATGAQLDRPAAGKTGTTQNNGDAWFAGYTPNVTAVVWMGYPEGPERPMTDVRGGPVTGGSLPVDIWKRFMDNALDEVEPVDFPAVPDDLLEPPELPETTLTLSPSTGPSGTTVTASGSGYEQCIVDWYVTFDPGEARSEGDGGSRSDERSASVVVPDGLGSGTARVTAWCDRGTGPLAVADAPFEVEGPEPEEEPEVPEDAEEGQPDADDGPPAPGAGDDQDAPRPPGRDDPEDDEPADDEDGPVGLVPAGG